MSTSGPSPLTLRDQLIVEQYRRAAHAEIHESDVVQQLFPVLLTAVSAILVAAFEYLSKNPAPQAGLALLGFGVVFALTLQVRKSKMFNDAYGTFLSKMDEEYIHKTRPSDDNVKAIRPVAPIEETPKERDPVVYPQATEDSLVYLGNFSKWRYEKFVIYSDSEKKILKGRITRLSKWLYMRSTAGVYILIGYLVSAAFLALFCWVVLGYFGIL